MKILSVKIDHMPDYDPDFSHLGEYSDEPGPDDRTIDREERGDKTRGTFRYFIAAMSGDETGNPESVEQDYERMEDYNRGYWAMVGIRTVANVQLTEDGPTQIIASGGLWGIESDSDSSYLDSVASDELRELRNQLNAAGFDDEAIDAAFADEPELADCIPAQ